MALYNTVSVPCQQSCWSLQEIKDYTLNTNEVLTVGMCWWDGVQCFEILSLNGAVVDPIVPTAVYNNCDECFNQNQLGAFIFPCSGGLRENFWLPGYAICEGATYEFNGVCFQTGRIEPYFPGKQEPITFPEQPTLIGQESCLLCLQSGYTYVYGVTDCLTSETHIVGSDISYSCVKKGGIYSYVLESDPTIQRCGELRCLELVGPIVEGFITGFIGNDENSCDVCLGQSNKKVEVINCIDQSIDVVWASTFFNVDDITFIDFTVPGREGSTQIRCCYTIGDETEAEVTIPTILSYSVSPSCPECIECNGVYYLWEDCNNSEITGSSLSYQYMTVGQTFVSPSNDGSCKKVIGASTNLTTDLLAGSLVKNQFTVQNDKFNDRVRFFFEQPDGKFLIGGHFTSFGLNTTNKIARLNSDGTYDNTFVGGFDPSNSNKVVINIDQQSDGKILVAGNFTSFDNGITTNTNNYICRLNTDGTFDTTFLPVLNNTGFDNTTQYVEVQNDGKILVGGWFDNYDDGSGLVLANRLIRLNSDGSVDSTFNTGTGFINNTEGDNGRVFQTKTQLDGKIIVVGQFDEYDGLPAKGIIRLNSDGSRDTTFNMGTGFDGNPLDGYGYYLARWINLYPDGKMLISGHFEYYDGQPASKLIRLNSDGSVDTTFTSLGFGPNYFDDRAIQTQIQPDGKIIVGGFFETYDSQSYEKLIRLNSDGTIDTSFYVGSGFNDYVLATYITSDYRLLVGGQFTNYKGIFIQEYITELNLTPQIDTIYSSPIFTDCPNCVEQTTSLLAGRIFPSEMNGGIDDIALSMREQPDGKILIGGWFGDYNGDSVNSIIRINPDGTLDPTFQNVGLLNDAAYGIDLQSDGKILVGGWFDDYDSQPIVNGFARLNTDGTLDTTFLGNTGFTVNSQQYANNVIKVLPDDKILVGGGFVNYNNMDYRGVMKFNQDGSVDTTFNVSGTGVYNDFNPSNVYQEYVLNMAGTFQCSATDVNKRFVSTGDEIFVSTSGTPLTISESFKIPTSISQLIYSENISLLVGWNSNTVIVIDPITYSVVSNQTYSNVNFGNGITNDSNYLYLYNNNVTGVYVIDILTNTLVTTIFTSVYVADMSYNNLNNRVYFTAYDSNVYYIDTLTNTLTTINVGNGPYNYITIDTVNNKLYLPRVFNVPGFPRQVVVVDCVTETISTIIPLPNSNYGDLVFDKDNGVVYATNEDLIVIDTSTDTIIESQTNWNGEPSRLFYDVNEKMLFSTNNREIYDPLSTKDYVSSYDFSGGRGVENTSNNFYYILKNVPYTTSYDVYMLYAVNSQTGRIESVISLPERGNFIIYEPTIDRIYVTTDNYLLEIDGNTNTITNSLGGTYYDLTYEYGFIYAVDYTNNYLVKIDPSTYTITNLSVGVAPAYLTKDLDNNRIYVSNSGSNDISVVDLSGFTVTNTVGVGNNPTRLIYNYNDQTIYVFNSGDNNFSYINASTLIVGGTFAAVSSPVIDLLIDVNGYMFDSISGQYNIYNLVTKTIVGGQGTGANYTTLFGNSSGNIMSPSTYYLFELYSFSHGRVYSFNVQSDGSILMGGYFKYYNNTISPNLIKVLSNGQIDPTFNIGTGFSGGGSPLPGSVRNILRQSDGKFICTGHFTDYDGNSVNRIVRLNSDGSIDNTFNIGTGFDNRVLNSVLQSDGKIICIGEFEDYNGTSVNRIVRLNSDGSIDNTFNIGNGFDDLARTSYLLSDNTLLVSGYFNQYDDYPNSDYLVRLATEPIVSNYTWYEFLPCNGDVTGYIIMDSTFNLVGNIVRANYSDNSIICGTIGDLVIEFPESGDMYTLTSQTTYESCVECNNGLVYGVTLRNCNTNELLTRNMNPTTVFEVLLNGSIFSTFSGVDCYQLLDFCVIPNDSQTIIPYYIFNNCTSCLAPRSANTQTYDCVICCSCDGVGSTTSVTPPNPVWTDGYGKAVVQMNMVVLGGINGLNG